MALYQEFTERPDGFADKYMELLSAGGSEWPHELVAKMGLDITDPNFWNKGLKSLEMMIEEAEELNKQISKNK
jgi:oligoendopeptidase F